MKRIYLILAIAFATVTVNAQDATVKKLQADANKEVKSLDSNGWRYNGTFILNVNQGTLSNWSAGGEQNTLGINFLFNSAVDYRHGKNTWDNYFDLELGFQDATSFGRFRKTSDLIDVTSKYGYQIGKKMYVASLVNFNSQSLPGYDYSTNTKISNFLTPGKILASVGIDYRPTNQLSIFISPITTRWILKNDKDFFPIDKFGVAAFTKSYNEIGAYLTAKYSQPISKWAIYTGRLDLFSNYKRNPQNVDLYFSNLLALQFNKWLASTISVDMLYDDDDVKRLQIKEIFGIGFIVKFSKGNPTK